jgi:hypothetical protein
VNAFFQQPARDLAMCFGRNCETHRIDAPDQLAPIPGPFGVALITDVACGLFVEIAHADKLRSTFSGECGVNARVLAAETADADDCCT